MLDFGGKLTKENLTGVAAKVNMRVQSRDKLKFLFLENEGKVIKLDAKDFNFNKILDRMNKGLI